MQTLAISGFITGVAEYSITIQVLCSFLETFEGYKITQISKIRSNTLFSIYITQHYTIAFKK